MLVQIIDLPHSVGAGWSPQAKSPAGAVQSALWRELDSSSSRATAKSPVVMRCARRLSELRSSSVSGGTADGGKNMRAARPHTPRQVRSPAPRQTEFAVMKVQMMFYRQSQYFSIKKFFSD